MKIIELVSENVKRLKAVRIKPDGSMVEIKGKNGQGKTSVLDSIWMALGGEKMVPGQPIRKGEKNAKIELDLGDFKVIRTFTAKTTTLKIVNRDGFEAKAPQKILDDLLGGKSGFKKLAFDPLDFIRMDSKKQAEILKGLIEDKVNVDRDKVCKLSDNALPADYTPDGMQMIDDCIEVVYESRTEKNREAKKVDAKLKDLNEELKLNGVPQEGRVPEIINVRDLFDKRKAMESENDARVSKRADWDREQQMLNARIKDVDDLKLELEKMERNITFLENDIASRKESQKKFKSEIQAMPRHDLTDIDEQITTADDKNRITIRLQEALDLNEVLKDLNVDRDKMNNSIRDLLQYKNELIAEADLPISGLEVVDKEVHYNGIPLDQASDAEKLKIGLSIAMALNPEVRVIRIKDGSLLDSESMKWLAKSADLKNYQIWVERVADSKKGDGIFIEDGEVR